MVAPTVKNPNTLVVAIHSSPVFVRNTVRFREAKRLP